MSPLLRDVLALALAFGGGWYACWQDRLLKQERDRK